MVKGAESKNRHLSVDPPSGRVEDRAGAFPLLALVRGRVCPVADVSVGEAVGVKTKRGLQVGLVGAPPEPHVRRVRRSEAVFRGRRLLHLRAATGGWNPHRGAVLGATNAKGSSLRLHFEAPFAVADRVGRPDASVAFVAGRGEALPAEDHLGGLVGLRERHPVVYLGLREPLSFRGRRRSCAIEMLVSGGLIGV